jgi:hypothetical protein
LTDHWQALWNTLCTEVIHKDRRQRTFVPGGLFCGLREDHVVRELHRLWRNNNNKKKPQQEKS